MTSLRGRPYGGFERAVADNFAAKSPSGPHPLAPSAEASLAALSVDVADLPSDIRDRVLARAHARAGRLAIGRYVITGELGRGGMGVVYDAWDPRIDRRVAVKTIEPDLVPDEGEREEVIERFLREIKVVGKLQHPSIVTIFDYGEDPELRRGDDPYASGRIYYYVMEYLEGRSLAKILREKKQLVDLEAVQIALDVAEALRVAHARGIIHRDIKPSNILICSAGGEEGRAVLLDFGIAKTGQPALTRQGQILGTPTYLAPERLREKEEGLDGRADIFSLGVLLYTMLVGEAPFQGDNVYDLLDNIAKQTHAKLARSTQGGVVLSRIIDRMLAKRPQDRYATADEVAQALRQARSLLESSTPDVSDLGAGLVLVSEPMSDAATEVATPSEPIPTPALLPLSGPSSGPHGGAVAKPGDVVGTSPEVSLHRSTRRIDVGEVVQTSPSVWDPEGSIRELDEADLQPLDALGEDEGTDSGETAGATMPGNRRPDEPPPQRRPGDRRASLVDRSDNGGGVTLKASASMQMEAVRAPGPPRQVPSPPIPAVSTHELRSEPRPAKAPVRRMASLAGEEETLAEPLGIDDDRHEVKTASEIRLDTVELPAPQPLVAPRVPTSAARGSRRPRIEASLVDEEDVVVRPAPLDSLRPDEVPTQAGVPSPSGGTPAASPSHASGSHAPLHAAGSPSPSPAGGTPVARPGDPLETDIVRPRRVPLRDPAEQGRSRDLPSSGAAARRSQELELQERPTTSVPPPAPAGPSAAVARRTIAARGASVRRPAPAERGDHRGDDIRVTGTDLDRPGAHSRAVRLRLAALLGLAAISIGVGLYLGRRRDPHVEQATAPSTPAPELRAVVGEAPPAELPTEVVAPRSVAEIVSDAESALAAGRMADADRLFARALESAAEGSEIQARALVGRAKVLAAQGENDRAERLLRRVVETRSDGPELREARALLGGAAATVAKKPSPRPAATPGTAPAGGGGAPVASAAGQPPASAAPRAPASSPAAPPVASPAASAAASPVASASPEPRIDDLSIDDQCRAIIRRYLNDPQGGITQLELLGAKAPNAACVPKQLGTFYRKIGNDRAALGAYRRYLELDPKAPDRASIESRIDSIASRLGS